MAWNLKFGFGGGAKKPEVLTDESFRFSLSCPEKEFVTWFVRDTYETILTDCFSRTAGLEEKQERALWDSCVDSDAHKGLISLLAEAMSEKKTLTLVYTAEIVRKAESADAQGIKEGSVKSITCSFANYSKTTLLKMYSGFLYDVIENANVGLKISKSVQLKVADLRPTQENDSSDTAKEQGREIVSGVKEGKAVLLDARDTLLQAAFDATPMKEGFNLFSGLCAKVIQMPQSYVNGLLAQGISTTGESDALAVEKGLRAYFNRIVRPVCLGLFGAQVSFKSDNWRKLQAVAGILPALEISTLVTQVQKEACVAELFE